MWWNKQQRTTRICFTGWWTAEHFGGFFCSRTRFGFFFCDPPCKESLQYFQGVHMEHQVPEHLLTTRVLTRYQGQMWHLPVAVCPQAWLVPVILTLCSFSASFQIFLRDSTCKKGKSWFLQLEILLWSIRFDSHKWHGRFCPKRWRNAEPTILPWLIPRCLNKAHLTYSQDDSRSSEQFASPEEQHWWLSGTKVNELSKPSPIIYHEPCCPSSPVWHWH